MRAFQQFQYPTPPLCRPGEAQAELLAEVNKYESERNLVLAEFRNYQQGVLPAGPGARSLTEFFASVDEKLEPAGNYIWGGVWSLPAGDDPRIGLVSLAGEGVTAEFDYVRFHH